MCKSALYACNTAAQTTESINFGSVVRRFGENIALNGGNVATIGKGYYSVDTNFTVLGTGTGTAVITLYKDGSAIPGATASQATVSGSNYAVSIPCIIRNLCCCESEISAEITGGSIANASIKVEKL